MEIPSPKDLSTRIRDQNRRPRSESTGKQTEEAADGEASRERREAWEDTYMTLSPKVLAVSWGKMEVEGLEPGKDFKLYPGGGRPWDWSETGTSHRPGIQPADVTELLDRGATTVVLSRGMDLQLEVDPRTLAFLAERGVTVRVAETTEAVRVYNELAATTPVGGLFHSTC
jgi:hypothetical protein